MKNRKMVEPPAWQAQPVMPERCPLCERLIPASQRDLHHWIPKLKGGKDATPLHRLCHRQIHALFSETELAQHYSTPAALLNQTEYKQFIDWVKTKPDAFLERTRSSKQRNGKKRRQ
jgi:hypothetical protein